MSRATTATAARQSPQTAQPAAWVPRPDQEALLGFLRSRNRSLIFGPTGSGKTAVTATWLHELIGLGEVKRVLIVAPLRVARDSWASRVWSDWEHLTHLLPEVQQLVDTDFDLTKDSSGGLCFRDKRATKKHLVAKIQAVTISVVSWDFFVFLAKALGKTRLFDAVVFDESSMMKDPSSTRTRAARHIVDETVSFLALLTATPASNADEHVWAQASLVSPGILGWTITDFRDKYSEPATKNWQTGQIYSYRIRPSMRAQFLEDIARCSISVKPMLDVPLVERPIMVKLGEKARGAYRTLTKDNIWEGITAGSAGVLHSKQRQLASGFIYDEHGNVRWLCAEKGRALKSLLRDLGDEQVVIVHQFDAESDNLHEMLGDDVEDIKTPGAMARFLSKDLKYLSLHPKSAGHGVDGLQWVAKHMVFLSVPEDYELWVQTVGRVHRHGTHADVVTIWVLIGQDTIEEDIYHEVLPRKARRQAELLGACA